MLDWKVILNEPTVKLKLYDFQHKVYDDIVASLGVPKATFSAEPSWSTTSTTARPDWSEATLASLKKAAEAVTKLNIDRAFAAAAQAMAGFSGAMTSFNGPTSQVSTQHVANAVKQLGRLKLGFQLASCHYMADWVQFRFPKTKKRRIRRKWAKQSKNYRWKPWNYLIQMGDRLFGHPTLIAQIECETLVYGNSLGNAVPSPTPLAVAVP